eukprot:COSAG01_NODE_494_length_16322_cov_35.380879_2_plen_50_part_00
MMGDLDEEGASVDAVAQKCFDVLRYTCVLPDRAYVKTIMIRTEDKSIEP